MADTNLDKMNAIAQQYMKAGQDQDNARAAAVAQKLGMAPPQQAPQREPASASLHQPSGMTADEVAERAKLLQDGASPTSHPRLKELNAKYLASD